MTKKFVYAILPVRSFLNKHEYLTMYCTYLFKVNDDIQFECFMAH